MTGVAPPPQSSFLTFFYSFYFATVNGCLYIACSLYIWRPFTGSRYVITFTLVCIHDSKEIPAAIPMFWGRATRLDYCGDCTTCGLFGNEIWRPFTGSRYVITFTLACIHDSNEIPTAIPMFSGSGYTSELVTTRCPTSVWEICRQWRPETGSRCETTYIRAGILVLWTEIHGVQNHFRSEVYKEFRCYNVYKLSYTLCHIYFGSQATIFDFAYTSWRLTELSLIQLGCATPKIWV